MNGKGGQHKLYYSEKLTEQGLNTRGERGEFWEVSDRSGKPGTCALGQTAV